MIAFAFWVLPDAHETGRRAVKAVHFGVAMGVVIEVVGVCELIAGVRLVQMAQYWSALAGWQRGVIGTLLAIMTFVVASAIAVSLR